MSNYPCNFCGTVFGDPSSLQRHFVRRPLCQVARGKRLQGLASAARRDLDDGRTSSPLEQQQQEPRQSPASDAKHSAGEGGFAECPEAHAEVAMDIDNYVTPGAENVPEAVEQPPPDPPQFERRQYHGYATVEVHKTATRVIQWEFIDKQHERSPSDILRHQEWFKLGKWLAKSAMSNNERVEYFEIQQHTDGSPWKSLRDFRQSVDALPRGPEWIEDSVTVTTNKGSKTFPLPRRCPLAVVRYLIGLTRLWDHMCYAPEEHTTTTFDGRKIRVWSEMWTGEWWWRLQNMLKEGITIAPLIIATDETNLTKLSGSKVAWPVYASIGNICKAVRRRPSKHGMMLIGFLPVARLTWITDKDERQKQKWELFNAAMEKILAPLKDVPEEGVEMRCANSGVRKVVTPLAVHISDWPKQCKVGSTSLTRCPTCIAPFHKHGNLGPATLLQTNSQTLDGVKRTRRGHVATQVGLGLWLVMPYWHGHPSATGPASLQPDLLHQLWKGVYLVHLFAWWKKLIGVGKLDKRYMGLPRHNGHQHFANGVSLITQWTGNKARATAHAFLPIVAGERMYPAVRATRGIMDFTYQARMPQLNKDNLKDLAKDLEEFHTNKDYFRRNGVHTSQFGFNGIAKLHFIRHYPHLTREMGTPDNFSTKTPERLHKDFVKEPYEHTSHVNPLMQIAAHLGESEAWAFLRSELEEAGEIERKRRRVRAEEEPINNEGVAEVVDAYHDKDDYHNEGDKEYGEEGERANGRVGLNRGLWVSAKGEGEPRGALPIRRKEHEVFQFQPRITWASEPVIRAMQGTNIIQYRNPLFIKLVVNDVSQVDANLAFKIDEYCDFGVWTHILLTHNYLPFAPLNGRLVESVRASSKYYNACRRVTKPAFFDAVLLDEFPEKIGLFCTYLSLLFRSGQAEHVAGYHAARVQLIFRLPVFCRKVFSEPLVLVELFKPFDTNISSVHQLVTVSLLKRRGQRVRCIVPVSKIAATCQLVPHYLLLEKTHDITAESDLLSIATRFYLLCHSSYYFRLSAHPGFVPVNTTGSSLNLAKGDAFSCIVVAMVAGRPHHPPFTIARLVRSLFLWGFAGFTTPLAP